MLQCKCAGDNSKTATEQHFTDKVKPKNNIVKELLTSQNDADNICGTAVGFSISWRVFVIMISVNRINTHTHTEQKSKGSNSDFEALKGSV